MCHSGGPGGGDGGGGEDADEGKGQAETLRTGVWGCGGNGAGQDVRRNMRGSVDNRATDQIYEETDASRCAALRVLGR